MSIYVPLYRGEYNPYIHLQSRFPPWEQRRMSALQIQALKVKSERRKGLSTLQSWFEDFDLCITV
jgi:hypothetical protein